MWEKDEPEAAPAEAEEEEAAGAASSGGARETMEVVVSDMTDANGMYVQVGMTAGVWGGARSATLAGLRTGSFKRTGLGAVEHSWGGSRQGRGWPRCTGEPAGRPL